MPLRATLRRLAANGAAAALVVRAGRRGPGRARRALAATALLGMWATTYRRYRTASVEQTQRELEQLRSANWDAFTRHYNERVPTVEEEFELWGPYHQHRHEMRYDLVAAAVRRHLPRQGGRVLDVGCGSALVADRLLDLDAEYLGADFGGHHIRFAARKPRPDAGRLRLSFVRSTAESLPVRTTGADVVVMTEVIEHLLRPELAVWEVSRVLRPGGVFVMTTNNASELPLRSPLTHGGVWLERALGANHPRLLSLRPWVWPIPVDRELVPEGSPEVHLPHTHHIPAETRGLFAAAGLETFHSSTFEFPPPQSATARWLDARGGPGRRAVDALEAVARRLPLVRRMGAHMLLLAVKTGGPVAPEPPPGVWPGPFSDPLPATR